jgi:hypothetical protein
VPVGKNQVLKRIPYKIYRIGEKLKNKEIIQDVLLPQFLKVVSR